MSKKKPIYEKMSSKMKEAGYDRDADQVTKKVSNLRQLYKKYQPGPTGDETPSWKFYEALHKILHERPALNTDVAKTSEIGISEEELLDPDNNSQTIEQQHQENYNNEGEELENTSHNVDNKADKSPVGPPPRKKMRVSQEMVKLCNESLQFMKEEASKRAEEREETKVVNSQLLQILSRIATSSESMASSMNPSHVYIHELQNEDALV